VKGLLVTRMIDRLALRSRIESCYTKRQEQVTPPLFLCEKLGSV